MFLEILQYSFFSLRMRLRLSVGKFSVLSPLMIFLSVIIQTEAIGVHLRMTAVVFQYFAKGLAVVISGFLEGVHAFDLKSCFLSLLRNVVISVA